jgi:putative phage-type endonuclease
MTFTRVDHDQGSDVWLSWRHDGIGGSEAAAIMGENPWKSRGALFNEKCRPPRGSRGNGAMQKGHALEPIGRAAYMDRCAVAVEPLCIEHSDKSWLRASLDGMSACGRIAVEIKCGAKAYEMTAHTKRVPKYYVGQVQHIMAVASLDGMDFCCYWPGEPLLILPVPRDEAYIARLLRAEETFWKDVLIRRAEVAEAA